MIRHDWTLQELKDLYEKSLFSLISEAHLMLMQHHLPGHIQVCQLISIKTGGCPENCKYCAQSSHYQTSISPQSLMEYDEVLACAKKAIARGASRICLGAAWRNIREGKQFDEVLKMIEGISDLGAEVCCTFGMLTPEQADKLKKTGVHSYNHNLDTSESFYKKIVTTRTYQDRLKTLDHAQQTGLKICCGCILGMGETVIDRLEFLLTLSNRSSHPGSIPINLLEGIPGTPLENQPKIPFWEFVRMIALARLVFPKTMIRLSAGRLRLSNVEQALCFFAGANSIHSGDKLLTVDNQSIASDEELFEILGLKATHSTSKTNRVPCPC